MAKSKKKQPARKSAARSAKRSISVPAAADAPAVAPDDQVMASNLTLHELFQQQTAQMLDRADLTDEQKQSILIGMSCPCCGAGGFSFTAKLKRGK